MQNPAPPKTAPATPASKALAQDTAKSTAAPPDKPGVTGQGKTVAPTQNSTAAPPSSMPGKLAQETPKPEIKLPMPTMPLPTAPLPAFNGAPVEGVKQEEPFRIGSILEPALWLVAALLLMAGILTWIKRYQQKEGLENRDSAHDQLANFRQALEDGEMSEEEFRKVKSRLTEKIREPATEGAKRPADLSRGPSPTGDSQ